MSAAETEPIDPIERIATLSYLSASYANRLLAAKERGLSTERLQGLISDLGREAVGLKEQYGISEEDFFEAAFQPDGWKDRITYRGEI